jgi:hypothetical protein
MNYDTQYDALMFAKTPELARKAARELARVILGDEAVSQQPLEESLREVCRKIRPSSDPKEQARFESEFVELAAAPNSGQRIAA